MRLTLRSAAFTCALTATTVAFAGDITPPAGPVQETGRFTINPQTATFPIQITQPGSYVLLGDLSVPASTNGIEISASHVTIDLNGFNIDGGDAAYEGIADTAQFEDITVRNGSISNFDGGGIFIAQSLMVLVEGIRANGNALEGAFIGLSGVIRDSVFAGNSFGVAAGDGVLIVDCEFFLNTETGIFVGDRATIRDCNVAESLEFGISIGEACVVRDNNITVTTPTPGGAGILQRADGLGRSRIESNHIVGYNPAIRVHPDITLAEVFIVKNSILGQGLTSGIEVNDNQIVTGIEVNPAIADAWDNLFFFFIMRSQDESLSESAQPIALESRLLREPGARRK